MAFQPLAFQTNFQQVLTDTEVTGGGRRRRKRPNWAFLNDYDAELQRRRARDQFRKLLDDETEQIQDDLDREIARELRKQEAIDERRKDLDKLAEIAKANADLEAARQYSERIATAYARAIAKGSFSALEALDRELRQAREEEEFLLTVLLMLAD